MKKSYATYTSTHISQTNNSQKYPGDLFWCWIYCKGWCTILRQLNDMNDIRSLFNCIKAKSVWLISSWSCLDVNEPRPKLFPSFFLHETEDTTTFHANLKEEETFMKPPRQQSGYSTYSCDYVRLLAGQDITQQIFNQLFFYSHLHLPGVRRLVHAAERGPGQPISNNDIFDEKQLLVLFRYMKT